MYALLSSICATPKIYIIGGMYMLIVFAVIFSISSIIISYGMREDNDPLLILKLIALYLLSVFTISFNKSFPIPIGFLQDT
jgi:hypothetical protein